MTSEEAPRAHGLRAMLDHLKKSRRRPHKDKSMSGYVQNSESALSSKSGDHDTEEQVIMDLFKVTAVVAIDVSAELDDDHVEVWAIPWHIRADQPAASDAQVMMIGEAVLRALLDRDVRLGRLDGTTGKFVDLNYPDPIDVIMTSWRSLGRDPEMGEIGWLSLEERDGD